MTQKSQASSRLKRAHRFAQRNQEAADAEASTSTDQAPPESTEGTGEPPTDGAETEPGNAA